MNPILKNVLAVIADFVAGSIVNMGLVTLGPMLIPPPEGADLTTMEGLEAAMPLMETKHFLMPFLAHALGTLVGAFVAAKIATTRKMAFALGIGGLFLLGGLTNVFLLPSPMWFNALDLVVAYVPMALIGGKLANR